MGETVRVRRSVKLADKDREHGTATCEAVRLLRQKQLTKVSTAPTVRRSVDANKQARERAETTRNEVQLNCVSLRSQLDCEVTGGLSRVKTRYRDSSPTIKNEGRVCD
jgi:hypothetical protein